MSRARRSGPVAKAVIVLIRGYQLVPRVGPPRCRFHPSCSAYAVDALRLHGLLRGVVLTVWRLARCHPFHPGGVEHVPEPGRDDRGAPDGDGESPARRAPRADAEGPGGRSVAGPEQPAGRASAGRASGGRAPGGRASAGSAVRASVRSPGRS